MGAFGTDVVVSVFVGVFGVAGWAVWEGWHGGGLSLSLKNLRADSLSYRTKYFSPSGRR